MRRALAVLLHLYLAFRIVCCPCLTGQNVHDDATRSLFVWGGAATIPDDDIASPADRADEAGVCLCDGADPPTCPEMPPSDRSGTALDAPDPHAFAPSIALLGLPADLDPRRHPPGPPDPDDAGTLRARLQHFRC